MFRIGGLFTRRLDVWLWDARRPIGVEVTGDESLRLRKWLTGTNAMNDTSREV